MESIITPSKVQYTPSKDNLFKSTVTIEPCFPGYGSTIGNALRRVLLSSLPGAAVTGFKIKGVHHEFSTLPGVMEDVIEITINLKSLRFKVFSDVPVRLELSAQGKKVVTANDITKNADVEIVNKDQVIATLSKADAKLDMELIVERGRGFVTSESQKVDSTEVDLIAIDAIFNPIRAVGYEIENVRVGKMTNYERLILHIETDGSITPKDAIGEAVSIIQEQMRAVGTKPISDDDKDTIDPQDDKAVLTKDTSEDTKKAKVTKRKPGRPKKSVE